MKPSGHGKSAAKISFVTAWYNKILVRPSNPTSSGNTVSGLPSFPVKTLTRSRNALLVGANTVNGPSPAKVSATPVAFAASHKIENADTLHAISAVVIVGNSIIVAGGGKKEPSRGWTKQKGDARVSDGYDFFLPCPS